jgi:diguanylate cyclase (GGDEF)-like protein
LRIRRGDCGAATRAPRSGPPLEVYAEQVDSLYAQVMSLMIALACAVFVGWLTTARTGSVGLGAATVAMALTGAYRVIVVWRYRSRPPRVEDGFAAFRVWERWYALGTFATSVIFGAMCFIGFVWTGDTISQLILDATTVAYASGAATRNTGRRRLALWPVALSLGPLTAGAALHGGFAYEALAALTAFYWLATTEIGIHGSERSLRFALLSRENERLAASLAEQNRRLDDALANMSHGLCMFNGEGRLVLINRRMKELFDIPEGDSSNGSALSDLAGGRSPIGDCATASVAKLARDLVRCADQTKVANAILPLDDGRVISWSKAPTRDGGSVVIFEDVTEREEAQARARYLSTHDSLTGLPNRPSFEQMLQSAVRANRRHDEIFCLMFIDLDRFKLVNDTLGHSAGDVLLKETAARLKSCLRDGDIVARLGGDEFVVILHDVGEPKKVQTVAERIAQTLAAPFDIQGQECCVSASIGVASYPTDASDEEALLTCADAAMYQVKQEGKNNIRFFSPELKTASIERLGLESALRRALENNEFVLHYQPKRRIATGEIVGVEALLRWRRPQMGLLAPECFLSVAEETGLIVPIGKWVLHSACQQNQAWRHMGLPDLQMAINLSPRQFADADLVEAIEGALAQSGMPAELLEIEITESMAIRDHSRSEKLIRAIRDIGARVAIDDFGAGHSTMGRLKHLSIDTIKIDRSFVQGIFAEDKDRAIVEAILNLGRGLKLNLVGEGVETKEQEDFLAAHGCDDLQGFLLARPLPPDKLADFVREYDLARERLVQERDERSTRTAVLAEAAA